MTTVSEDGQSHRASVEAASWALAAELLGALGEDFTIIAGAPGGGTYDLLWIFRKECLIEGSVSGPQACLNRNGSLHAGSGGELSVLAPADVWERIANGEAGVAELVSQLLRRMDVPESRTGGVEVLACRVLATIAAQAALYRTGWSVQHAVTDVSGWPLRVAHELLAPYNEQLPRRADLLDVDTARAFWLVADRVGDAVACVDMNGRLLRPDFTHVQAVDVTVDADDLALAASLSTELIHQWLERDVFAEGVGLPGLGLPSVLSAFNRKERFFVTTQATGLLTHAEIHGAALPLSAAWRRRLTEVLGVEVPAHAYAATDFHLSWLHAALSWWQGRAFPRQVADFPNVSNPAAQTVTSLQGEAADAAPAPTRLVDGSQEDIDLLVSWSAPEGTYVVAVEAKAYGAWSNGQMKSKVARLRQIDAAAGGHRAIMRLVLTSRRPPQQLLTEGWPSWATDEDGGVLWMPLSAPGLRLATTRCDDQGRPTAEGVLWKITGPAGM